MSAAAYTLDILRLTTQVAAYPRLDAPDASVERRTPICGSRIIIDVALDADGRVGAVGMSVQACVFGQAAAALFAAGAAGRSVGALEAAAAQLRDWLEGAEDVAPDWPGIADLAPARTLRARHAAVCLPFETGAVAAREALTRRAAA